MAIVYRIYSNGGGGGPIDYSTPIAVVSGTTYATGPLTAPGDYRFGVRAYDTSGGVEELNTQATVAITLDANGGDAGAAPSPPFSPVARPTAGGGCRVAWTCPPPGQGGPPSSFLVYLTAGPTPVLTSPATVVPYASGTSTYSCQLSGLADGVAYSVAVVSESARGRSSAASVVSVVGDSTPPSDVDALTAIAIP